MDTYYTLNKLIFGVGLAFQLSWLALYTWAFMRCRNRCFIFLISGAAVGLIYMALAGIPYLISPDISVYLFIAKATLILLPIAGILGTWGVFLLVRSYLSLAGKSSDGPSASV